MSKWLLRRSTADVVAVARQAGVSPVLARILAVRGYHTPDDIKSFIDSKAHKLADPFLFADMDKAVAATLAAIDTGKRIAIYGDYDADGVMSTVILHYTLLSLGAEAVYYIPNRKEEGYGLNKNAIEVLAESSIDFIITCDNGISAIEEITYARSLGLEVVVLDHHAVIVDDEDKKLQHIPDATAVVDAKRLDCGYPFKHYCGAGICYRFSQAIYNKLHRDWRKLGEYCLPFVTIATICDLVDMTGENRDIVKLGLSRLRNCQQIGVKALLSASGLAGKDISEYHVGFILGPCINAAGRLDSADTAVELFLSEDPDVADEIAESLVEMNKDRRQLTENGAKRAFQLVKENNLAEKKIIVIYDEQFSESVAGIIAGKIKERYHRPAIVLAGEESQLHGSCRSVESYNIFEGLCGCSHYLNSFGGHPMAAGLTINAGCLDSFVEEINDKCTLSMEDLEPSFRIDCPLFPADASLDLCAEIALLGPYGKENPQPIFACKHLALEKISLMGKTDSVMRLFLRDDRGKRCEAIDFRNKERFFNEIVGRFGESGLASVLKGTPLDIINLDLLYNLSVNTFNGRESVQIQVVDFRFE